MPPELDDANIDVGDSEENATEVNLSDNAEESKPEPELQVQTTASDEELNDYSSNVKSRINDLTKRFREEERQKHTAIEFAESVRKENENLKNRLQNLDKGYIEQFEGRVDSQLESAKKALKELSLERSRVKVAKAPQPEPTQAPVAPATPQPQPQPQQPVQADPKAEAWAQKNQWFGEDEVMTYAAFGVHRRLIEDEGFDPTSNDYYDELDKRMRNEFPQKFESSPKSNGGRKVASAESSKSRNRSGRKTVRLTASQVAIAKRLNVPLEEYAKHVRN